MNHRLQPLLESFFTFFNLGVANCFIHAHNDGVTNKEQFWQSQADTWAMRRRDGVTFEQIASDSSVSIPTVRCRLKEYGYTMKGNKDGGGCDQTTNPLTPTTTVGMLNSEQSTTTIGELN